MNVPSAPEPSPLLSVPKGASSSRVPHRRRVRMAFGLAAGALLCTASFVSFVVGEGAGRGFPRASFAALLVLLASPLLWPLARRTHGARGVVALALTLSSFAPAVWPFVAAVAGRTLVPDPLWAFPDALSDYGILLPFALLFAAVVSSLVAQALVIDRDARVVNPILRGAAGLSVVVALLLCVGALARTARFDDADHWGRALPVLATLPAQPAQDETLPGKDPVDAGRAAEVPPPVFEQPLTRGWIARRTCEFGQCDLDVVRASSERDDDRYTSVQMYKPVLIRNDAEHGLWLFEQDGAFVGAYGPRESRFTSVPPARVSSTLSPPRGWTLIAAPSLLLALPLLVALALFLFARRARAERATLRPATLGADGWIHFGDGAPPFPAPSRPDLAPGPVLVRAPPTPSGPAFRNAGAVAPLEVLPGTLEELHRTRVMALAAYVFASCALLAAPLLAAAGSGLVF